MIRAICIGEAMVELRPVGPDLFARGIAGDAYNTAVYLRRALGPEDQVSLLTGLGDDALSAALRADFIAEGLDDHLAFVVPGRSPGLYLIELDARGERTFHYWRQASAARLWLAALRAQGGGDILAGADLIYFSGISLAILEPNERAEALALIGGLRGRVGHIAFDPNVRPRLWPDLETARQTIEAACAVSDIVLPSSVDGDLIWGDSDPGRQIERYRHLGPVEIALTVGEDGVRLADDDGEVALPALKVRAIDTSGAGDSFNGAYLAARLKGADPKAAAIAGQALAALVVTQPGALIKHAVAE